jgi:hypothetical protein
MANKTAMQELLEWTRRTLPMDLDTPRMIEDKIELLLHKEKKQIKDAYKNGILTEFLKISKLKNSEKYYRETYGK